jgi:hypothetical protein
VTTTQPRADAARAEIKRGRVLVARIVVDDPAST